MADTKKTWYSADGKTTVNNTDKILVYDGTKSYTVPVSAIKGSSSGSGSGGNWYDATQKLSANDTDFMPIYDGEDAYIVPISAIKGADNLTDEYVLLTGEDGVNYRVKIDVLGNPKVIKDSAYTATAPSESDNINDVYQALIINQMYGGGDLLTGASCSHSFIELYNLSNSELNLKGLWIWYKSGTSAWEGQELVGIIPPYSSYLIVGAEHNSIFKDDCRLKIEDYDMVFKDTNGNPKKFSNKGMSVYISIGNTTPDTNPLRFTTSNEGVKTFKPAFVDLMGCGGTDNSVDTVSAYETNYRFGMDKSHACRRIDFYNGGKAKDQSGYSNGTGDNASDCEIIDYSTCDVEKYRPRTSKEGHWDMFVSQDPINHNAPNAFVLGYGEEDTTRTFTWQSQLMKDGYVKYREKGTTAWTTVKAVTTVIQHPDCTVSKHSAIVKNLVHGKTYEYMVGSEGYWSDEHEFEIKDRTTVSAGNTIKILWESDEQSWTSGEMGAFVNVFNGIKNTWHSETQSDDFKMSDFDFILETGDISQNGRRRPEYYWYFDALQGVNYDKPIMATMGNNDLLEKKYGQCFANFFTNEGQWANSVYHFMVGNTEFICLNSNTDYDYVTGFGTLGSYQSTDEFLFEQAKWLDNYLTTRETNPTWTVVYMHLSPFTCVRTKRCQVFVPIFEKHKVPLVLCGHNHLYTRTPFIYTGMKEVTTAGDIQKYNTYYDFTKKATTTWVDERTLPNATGGTGINHTNDPAKGTLYIQCPSTGWKNSGKETHITKFPEEAVAGYDYNVNGHSDGRAWFSEVENTVKKSAYLTLEISDTKIVGKAYQITGAKLLNEYNGKTYEYSPEMEDANVTRELIDTWTINLSDRTGA